MAPRRHGSGAGRVTARSKGKADRFKRLMVDFFEELGFTVYARSIGEEGDDLVLLDFPTVSIELKNRARMELAEWWKQTESQAGVRMPILIHKRQARGQAEDQWVTMDLQTLLRLLAPHRVPLDR